MKDLMDSVKSLERELRFDFGDTKLSWMKDYEEWKLSEEIKRKSEMPWQMPL